MKKLALVSSFFAAVLIVGATLIASGDSPVGVWKTIDDKENKAKSHVEIYVGEDGKYYGKIKALLDPKDKGNLCTECKGADYNKPVEGLVIIKGLKKKGNMYEGGTILDPKDGKIYKCKIERIGNQLKVRGFIGVSLLGRTQTWHLLSK